MSQPIDRYIGRYCNEGTWYELSWDETREKQIVPKYFEIDWAYAFNQQQYNQLITRIWTVVYPSAPSTSINSTDPLVQHEEASNSSMSEEFLQQMEGLQRLVSRRELIDVSNIILDLSKRLKGIPRDAANRCINLYADLKRSLICRKIHQPKKFRENTEQIFANFEAHLATIHLFPHGRKNRPESLRPTSEGKLMNTFSLLMEKGLLGAGCNAESIKKVFPACNFLQYILSQTLNNFWEEQELLSKDQKYDLTKSYEIILTLLCKAIQDYKTEKWDFDSLALVQNVFGETFGGRGHWPKSFWFKDSTLTTIDKSIVKSIDKFNSGGKLCISILFDAINSKEKPIWEINIRAIWNEEAFREAFQSYWECWSNDQWNQVPHGSCVPPLIDAQPTKSILKKPPAITSSPINSESSASPIGSPPSELSTALADALELAVATPLMSREQRLRSNYAYLKEHSLI